MNYYKEPIVYGVKHRDEAVRATSRSGGVFTAVTDNILDNNGVVYGCIMKDCYKAIHIRCDSKSERDKMRGSKYVQSNLSNVFSDVKKDADSGKPVLFSGTPCQVAGLKSFLGRDYDNVFYLDIVCHGVPSPKIWNDYVQWQELKNKAHCVKVDFRNKLDFGWRSHVETLYMKDKSDKRVVVSDTIYRTLFCSDVILRPSCFKCPYKSINHPGDITLADFWGIEKVAPNFDDNKGVSLLLINTERGNSMIESVKEQLMMISSDIQKVMQPSLQRSLPVPETREQFWKDYNNYSFKKIAYKYGGYGFAASMNKFIQRVRNKISRTLSLKK